MQLNVSVDFNVAEVLRACTEAYKVSPVLFCILVVSFFAFLLCIFNFFKSMYKIHSENKRKSLVYKTKKKGVKRK